MYTLIFVMHNDSINSSIYYSYRWYEELDYSLLKSSSFLTLSLVLRNSAENFVRRIMIYGTRKFGFPERAGMTSVIGQIHEELKLDLAYQWIPSKLICQRSKDARVVVVMGCNQESGDHLIDAIHQTRGGWITLGLSMQSQFCLVRQLLKRYQYRTIDSKERLV